MKGVNKMTTEFAALPELVMIQNLWTLTHDEITVIRKAHRAGERVNVTAENFGHFGVYITKVEPMPLSGLWIKGGK